jgi:osmotically-inducible protein OsmY
MTTPAWITRLIPFLPEAPELGALYAGPWAPAGLWAVSRPVEADTVLAWQSSGPQIVPGAPITPGAWGPAVPSSLHWDPVLGPGQASAGAWGIHPWTLEEGSEPHRAADPGSGVRNTLEAVHLRLNSLPIDTQGLDVSFEDGVVGLAGVVGSLPGKRLIEDAVVSVAGVIDVRNDLQLAKRSDEEIVAALLQRFQAMSWAVGEDVGVESDAGDVTLRGDVLSFLLKRVLEDTALLQDGVKSVVNRLRVTAASAGPVRSASHDAG